MKRPYRILFVCLGNICRSPLAEGVFQHLVRKQGLEHSIYADSCGTIDHHVNDLPDPRSRKVARKNGFELQHRGQQFKRSFFKEFDLILVMDRSNLRDVRAFADSAEERAWAQEKVLLMSHFDPKKEFGLEVPDPYYGDEPEFEMVYKQLHFCAENLLIHAVKALENQS